MIEIPESPLDHMERLGSLLRGTMVTDRTSEFLSLDAGCRAVVETILATHRDRRKAMVVGNGGSSAIASHMQTDFANSLRMRSMVFSEPSLLTALANDFGYAAAFECQVATWADPGDLMVAISSSGRSINILNAVRAATERGARIVTFSGFIADNPLRGMGDVNFYVASQSYGLVETAHQVLAHYLTDQAGLLLKGSEA
jgi:D-sedoheptulose 7-phosphate isomerase